MENDGFNKLVLHAGLTAREVIVLRAYCKYLRQARIPFSQAYLEATLARNPGLTRNLVDLFLARFDPRHQKQSETSRSEEHTSELQSLMRISYAVFCLQQHTTPNLHSYHPPTQHQSLQTITH